MASSPSTFWYQWPEIIAVHLSQNPGARRFLFEFEQPALQFGLGHQFAVKRRPVTALAVKLKGLPA